MKFAEYVKFRKERFGGVLFETRSEKVFALNATAAAVASEIMAGTPRDAIADKLKTVSRATIRPGSKPRRPASCRS